MRSRWIKCFFNFLDSSFNLFFFALLLHFFFFFLKSESGKMKKKKEIEKKYICMFEQSAKSKA